MTTQRIENKLNKILNYHNNTEIKEFIFYTWQQRLIHHNLGNISKYQLYKLLHLIENSWFYDVNSLTKIIETFETQNINYITLEIVWDLVCELSFDKRLPSFNDSEVECLKLMHKIYIDILNIFKDFKIKRIKNYNYLYNKKTETLVKYCNNETLEVYYNDMFDYLKSVKKNIFNF